MKSTMSFKAVAVAAVLAVAATSSFANTPLTFASGVAAFNNTVYGQFTDNYQFSLTSPSSTAVSAVNVALSFGSALYGGMSSFSGYLDGVALDFAQTTQPVGSYSGLFTVLSGGTQLAPGLHTLTFSGITTGPAASYGGSIVTTPVPEPETYAMLLAGLAVMGGIARRRMKTTA